MNPRSHLPDKERRARSRLTKIIHEQPFLCGSLVIMYRKCGKPGCKCTQGELHRGLYLAIRVGEKRKMIHVPQSLEERVRKWVTNYQEAWQLMEQVSGFCFKRFFLEKEQLKRRRP